MAKFCAHCGSELEDKAGFCKNCGAAVEEVTEKVEANVVGNNTGEVVNNNTAKDNTTIAFVCSVIGALCCTYVAIPGLILSIMCLKDMNDGKIDSKNKWMAIVGIVLSCIGLIEMVINLIHF